MNAESTTLLDCTLRDGGYYTAWDFPSDVVQTYLNAAARLPIGVIELGYANPPTNGYFGQYYYLSKTVTERAREILREDQRLAVMVDEKVTSAETVDRHIKGLSASVDMIRMAVAPGRLAEASELSARLTDLGFKVGVNIMYLSTYWQSVTELPALDRAIATASVVSLVDSYGACTPGQVQHAIAALRTVDGDTTLGFHGHDNMRLAFANSLAATSAGASVIDSTVTGMGRGPGNTQTETALVHMFASEPSRLDYGALHRLIEPFQDLQKRYGWGTNLVYMISGAAGLPQNRVMDWLGKNRYSVPAIISALHHESLGNVDETSHPSLPLRAREVVVIGGGASVSEHADAIVDYANKTHSLVVHANYRHLDLVKRIRTDQVVALAGDVLDRLPSAKDLEGCGAFVVPAAPRISPAPSFARDRTFQVPPFAPADNTNHLGQVSDIGPLSLALGVVVSAKAEQVTLVGFDGYEHASPSEQELTRESQTLLDRLRETHPMCDVSSGTRTKLDLPVRSIYAYLMDLDR